jgi:hypothetical protein
VLALVLIAAQTFWNNDLAKIRRATAKFHRTEAADYDSREGLDNCFDNPGVGGLGFHYINIDTLRVYVMHAWVWKNNPAGVWEDWNPNVFCP